MTQFNIDRIENFQNGSQIIIWLKDERTGLTENDKGLSYCVRILISEAPMRIKEFIDAYSGAMQDVAIDLAAGGCRTCHNNRRVFDRETQRWVACPNCTPRAEERLRKRIFGLRRRS